MSRIKLHNGACAKRWNCANINKSVCNELPRKGENFVECYNYSPPPNPNWSKEDDKIFWWFISVIILIFTAYLIYYCFFQKKLKMGDYYQDGYWQYYEKGNPK